VKVALKVIYVVAVMVDSLEYEKVDLLETLRDSRKVSMWGFEEAVWRDAEMDLLKVGMSGE
jgi:hypothetical protein